MNIFKMLTMMILSGLLFIGSLFFVGCQRTVPAEQLKPLVEKYVHAWNTGDMSGIEEFVSDQFEFHMSPRFNGVRSLDSLKQNITSWRTAYPDFHINLDEIIYAQDAITIRWTIRATNSGPGLQPPTGKTVLVPGMSILHVSGGKIVDEWVSGNDLYWAEQLGFTLSPTSPAKQIQ